MTYTKPSAYTDSTTGISPQQYEAEKIRKRGECEVDFAFKSLKSMIIKQDRKDFLKLLGLDLIA